MDIQKIWHTWRNFSMPTPTRLIMSDAKEHRQNSSLWVSDQSRVIAGKNKSSVVNLKDKNVNKHTDSTAL